MMIRFLDLKTVTDSQTSLWESWLAPGKRQRIDRLPQQKRLQSLCADALARQMLGEWLHIPPEDVFFTYDVNGKPGTRGAHFNVSHSADVVCCAVSEVNVGVDIEQIRSAPHRLQKAFGQEQQPNEAFFRLWTKREALAKCRGDSLGVLLRGAEESAGYCFSYPEAPEGYICCVCEKTN